MSNHWNNSLFGCLSDIGICLKGTLCPCMLFADNLKTLAGEDYLLNCLTYIICSPCRCIVHGKKRGLIREKYSLPEEPASDCLTTCCCSNCALCQEAREIQYRGPPAAQQMH